MAKPNRGGKRNREDPMNVPYDKWGKELTFEPIYGEIDGERAQIGYYEDQRVYDQVEDIRPVTKKQVLEDIDAWRMDDGTYGDEDTVAYIAYKDGTFWSSNDDDSGKAYKKTGIVGASISTGDYEMVWGGEIGRDGQLHMWETWTPDGEGGHTNSYSGYKPTQTYWIRYRVIHTNKRRDGTYYTSREKVRQSTKKKVEA